MLYNGLKAKHEEVQHNLKIKSEKFNEQGEALRKLEKARQSIKEECTKLQVELKHIQEEKAEQEKYIKIERDSCTKLKERLVKLENDYDTLNTKQNTAYEILQVENYELKHEIEVLQEKLDIFKSSRHYWIDNIDKETRNHDETRKLFHNQKLRLNEAIQEKKK